ncbi:hypothetical protein SAMN04489712_11533 [Thermomonospora echinospora]|uniref:Peptidoglycan binding domain-containing protein n=1 Tax=Thermomonospora echinospora TaxID=1992 RepID=A0A1H6DBG4_9ACTN|nr:hypothetical protein [Thermomonospora echinospora]SEG82484.1 hypothetical protein SAMN04489712_11533 [Thermomonospora echinospora]
MIKLSAGTASLAGLVLAGAGAMGGILLRPADPPPGLRAAAEVTSAPTATEQFTDERTVKVAMTVAPTPPLSVAATGRVTASYCTAGRTLKSGALAARINEKPVVALATKIPLYRDLDLGATGRDVAGLQQELRRLGHGGSTGGRYDYWTKTAVQRLMRAAGVSGPDGVLRISQVLWLPDSRVVPAKCSMVVGRQVSQGDKYATVPRRPASIRVSPMPADLAPGRRTIELMGRSGPLGKDGTVTDRDFLAALSRTREFQDLKPGDEPPAARIALAAPLRTVKVPPSAVFAVDGARGCLQSGRRVIPVRIVGSKLGTTLVLPDQAVPSTVNLGSSITARSCGHG